MMLALIAQNFSWEGMRMCHIGKSEIEIWLPRGSMANYVLVKSCSSSLPNTATPFPNLPLVGMVLLLSSIHQNWVKNAFYFQILSVHEQPPTGDWLIGVNMSPQSKSGCQIDDTTITR